MRCEMVTWGRFYALCQVLAARVRAAGYVPDLLVAIGRGGWMPGRVLSDLLGNADLTSFKVEHYLGPQRLREARVRYPLTACPDGRRVLLVDDVSDSGDTFAVALRHLRERGAPADLRTAVLHHKTCSRVAPDFFAQKVVRWRWIIYPWAVVEDVSGLLQEIRPLPATTQELLAELGRRHGLRRVPPALLEDALRMLRARSALRGCEKIY
jgi:hypothetical protein